MLKGAALSSWTAARRTSWPMGKRLLTYGPSSAASVSPGLPMDLGELLFGPGNYQNRIPDQLGEPGRQIAAPVTFRQGRQRDLPLQ